MIIWSRPHSGSTRKGMGYPGRGWEVYELLHEGQYYDCGHMAGRRWHRGRNIKTGVTGWVPSCNLRFFP